MKLNKYLAVGVLAAGGFISSCEPNEDLYPLPYDNRATGSFLRVIKINSNVWDLDDLANSGFEAVYESVDKNFGADLDRVEFYATHRSGATALITDEVLVKTLTAAQMNFAKVPEPTYSDYLRSGPIKITAQETLDALLTLTTDPDGTTCSNIFPDVCPAVAFPGSLAINDRVIFRVKIYDKQGRGFTVNNPQVTASPRLGNGNEANITPNLTGGLFYNSPMLYTMLMQRMTTTGNANAYTGDYRMAQVARWQPDHTPAQHGAFPQNWLRKFIFGNSDTDSTQTVTLQKVPGGLPTERQFTCKYRGQTITLRINFEQAVLNVNGAGFPGSPAPAALVTMQTATASGGLGFPAGTTNANLGTIFVPLLNTTQKCTSEREFFVTTPLAGAFAGTADLPAGVPRRAHPNRGYYRFDRDGLTAGDVFSITLDDDADEYGRRNGYCNWYTRIQLTLTKL
ncbi:MAG: hypothetical protein KF775_08845 [Cyclobacteriaceae bacterium]|nr:hypothetical protein [Cyclobacteriaceae bacterium]